MGGFGSGRGPYATTPSVEQCLHLDVNEFTDVVEEETAGRLTWRDNAHEVHCQIREYDDRGGRELILAYATERTDRDGSAVEDDRERHCYSITITFTDCNFGGQRPWWRCPHCHDRVGKLYLPPTEPRFKCRDCHDLQFRSSRESGIHSRRELRRYQDIQKKLGAEPTHPNSMDGGRPDRPKGMHQETYEELLLELRRASDEYTDSWMAQLRGMVGAAPHEDPEAAALEQIR